MGIDALLKNELDSLSTKPLYAQLTDQIKQMIRAGEISAGDLLPSEPLLCERLGISRSTVRQAFATLEAEGFVVRRRGKGTFVSQPKVKRRLSRLCSFSKQMSELGIESRSTVLELSQMDSTRVPGLSGMSGRVFKIVRLRETDGVPFMIDTVYVPVSFAPALSEQKLQDASLYDLVEQMSGKTPHMASETYEVVKLSAQQMQTLGTQLRPAFLVERTTKTVAGELYEVARMLIRGDRCRLEAMLEADTVAFSRTLQ